METVDVYAYGMISASTLHLLRHPFPPADGYAELAQTIPMTGGEALNSAIVLSRLGVRVQLDGTWLGDGPEGRGLLERIQGYGIDDGRLTVKKGYPGVREIVFSDNRTRTVFGNYVNLLSNGRKWNIPRKGDIQRARLVCVDPFFGDESSRAARYAIQAGIPFVSIDCAWDNELSTAAECVIISGEFRDREYPRADLEELFMEYQRRACGLVVFTVGSEAILYARPGQPIQRCQPYPVEVIDSAGAGDSFRAGIIYGLLHGWKDEEVVRYAAAVAALVCASFPGVLNSPNHAEVIKFIQKKEI